MGRLAATFTAVVLLVSAVSAGVFLLLRNDTVESPPGVASPPSGATTLVSLTFDDGYASQINAQRVLAQHGMNGTFYVPSGFIGMDRR